MFGLDGISQPQRIFCRLKQFGRLDCPISFNNTLLYFKEEGMKLSVYKS